MKSQNEPKSQTQSGSRSCTSGHKPQDPESKKKSESQGRKDQENKF